MIRHIFLDLDDTILDFKQAEAIAIRRTFSQLHLPTTDAVIQRYSQINQQQWHLYDKGEISRDQVLIRRFVLLFAEFGFSVSPTLAEETYRHNLGIGHYFVTGAQEGLDYLAKKYLLYIASNGVAETQYTRLESAGIGHCFQKIFISETTGAHKPEPAYFDYCFSQIPNFDPRQAVIIGDSLSSDILGGIQAGITTCWFNLRHNPPRKDIVPDYEVHSWQQIMDLF